MKRLFTLLLAAALLFTCGDAMAQKKSGKKGTKSGQTTTKKGKKGKKTDTPAAPKEENALPYNSNDCLFAIELHPDVAFGPTPAPVGAGRVMDVKADKKHPYLFEYEHNTVWYRFKVPYNGYLEFEITQVDPKDDYDFLLYKYTDEYFSNKICQNQVLPIAVNIGDLDTSAAKGPSMGMKVDGPVSNVKSKKQPSQMLKSIYVRKGEEYYLVLDNVNPGGSGHTVKVSIHVDAFEPQVVFYDPQGKKNVPVDLLILEKNTDNRPIAKDGNWTTGRVKFVPGFTYTLYAKRDGYFSVYKEFNSNMFLNDTILRFVMNPKKRGTSYPVNDVYFEDGTSNLLPGSDTVLMNYVYMFKNHPEVTFLIKGRVPTFGVDPKADTEISLQRAVAVKEFFVKNGISEDRMTVAGMNLNEVKRAANAAFAAEGSGSSNKNVKQSETQKADKRTADHLFNKIEIFITGVGDEPTKPVSNKR